MQFSKSMSLICCCCEQMRAAAWHGMW